MGPFLVVTFKHTFVHTHTHAHTEERIHLYGERGKREHSSPHQIPKSCH